MARPTTETVHRETGRHRDAFEVWYAADRDYKAVMKDCNVSMVSVYHWIEWFGWRAKADARDAEVERQATRAAIKRKADMLERHRKSGELAHRRGTEFFARNAITDERAALSALKIGSEMERTAEGLPAWMIAMMGQSDEELAAYIAAASGTSATGDSPQDSAGTGTGDPESGDDQTE